MNSKSTFIPSDQKNIGYVMGGTRVDTLLLLPPHAFPGAWGNWKFLLFLSHTISWQAGRYAAAHRLQNSDSAPHFTKYHWIGWIWREPFSCCQPHNRFLSSFLI
ncbi:hypothetical protein V6Z11_A12G253000 [Gossypium hirsutum]